MVNKSHTRKYETGDILPNARPQRSCIREQKQQKENNQIKGGGDTGL